MSHEPPYLWPPHSDRMPLVLQSAEKANHCKGAHHLGTKNNRKFEVLKEEQVFDLSCEQLEKL